jgi:predicted HicB family RNase H-like nuclease
MNTLTYKGYLGTISFSAEDEVFYGKIEHIRDMITFEADNAHQLIKSFEEAVDDYLRFCAEKGIEPEKPFRGCFNVRVKPLVHQLAYQKAMRKGISLNKYIETAIEKDLAE